MSSSSLRCKVIVLLLCALLTASGAFAAPVPLEILNRAWGLFTSLWSKTGCSIDPNGHYAPEPQKTGCHIDPNGGCVAGAVPWSAAPEQAETGCGIDPSGHCHP